MLTFFHFSLSTHFPPVRPYLLLISAPNGFYDWGMRTRWAQILTTSNYYVPSTPSQANCVSYLIRWLYNLEQLDHSPMMSMKGASLVGVQLVTQLMPMTLPTSRSGNFVWRQISLLGRMPLGQKSRQRHHKFIILSYSKAKLAKRKFSSSEILFLNFEAPKKFFDMKEKNYNSNLFPLLAGFSKILELSLTRENWPSSIFCL